MITVTVTDPGGNLVDPASIVDPSIIEQLASAASRHNVMITISVSPYADDLDDETAAESAPRDPNDA